MTWKLLRANKTQTINELELVIWLANARGFGLIPFLELSGDQSILFDVTHFPAIWLVSQTMFCIELFFIGKRNKALFWTCEREC